MKIKFAKVENIFTLDVRSLAIFRILLGIYIVLDAIDKFSLVNPFFSDNGVIPRSMVDLSAIEYAYHLQISLLSGSEWFGYIFLAILAIFGFLLIIGFKTRIVTVVCWLLFSSLIVRMDAISNSGDTLLIVLLFWAMFLPLGARFSIDSRFEKFRIQKRVFSAAAIALYIQFALVYITTGIFKGQFLSWHNGTHLYLTFSRFEYMNPIAFLIYPQYELLSFLTHFTLILELFGPLLFFIPIFFLPFRMLGIILFAGLQISIAITMKVAFFPISSLAGILVFIPTEFWEKPIVKNWFYKLKERFSSIMNRIETADNVSKKHTINYKANIYADMFVAVMAVYVLFWNLSEIPSPFSLPEAIKKPGYYLKLDQRWAMFSSTINYSYNYDVVAYYEVGLKKDLMKELKKEYESVNGYKHITFKNDRWRKLFSDQITSVRTFFRIDIKSASTVA